MLKKIIILLLIVFYKVNAQDPPQKTAIAFDIEVLLEIDKKKAFSQVGSFSFLWQMIKHKKTPIQLFDYLKKGVYQSLAVSNIVRYPFGDKAPQVIHQLFSGEISEQECINTFTQILNNDAHHFLNTEERDLAKQICRIFLNPKYRGEMGSLCKEGINLLKLCRQKGYTIFLFTNISKEALKRAKTKYPEIFKEVPEEHIIASCTIGYSKPEPQTFAILLKKLSEKGILKERIFLIDSQKENIYAAKLLGINGIFFNLARNPKNAYNKLIEFGLI